MSQYINKTSKEKQVLTKKSTLGHWLEDDRHAYYGINREERRDNWDWNK
jgi:hypothetical protein